MTAESTDLELSIIIPVFGNFDILKRCLDCVVANTSSSHEIVVVDDASPGGPPDFDEISTLVVRETNGGFAAAVNTGLRAARGRHVAVVNSDAFVEPRWDASLLASLHGRVSLAAAVQTDVDGIVFEAGTIVGPDGHIHLLTEAPAMAIVPALSAACVIGRRADLLAWGGLSREFGKGYYEDVDISLLAGSLGYRCAVVPEARVVHTPGTTFGPDVAQRRTRVGRAVLAKNWQRSLARRPPVHGWEALTHRAAFAASAGRSGRALLVGEGSWESIRSQLDSLDITWRHVEASDVSSSPKHWADVVIFGAGVSHPAEVQHDLTAFQPRAAVIGAESIDGLTDELIANGLGGQVRHCHGRSLVIRDRARRHHR